MIHGVGINDASYPISKCKIYKMWSNMLGRCYSKATLENSPTYIGCVVDDEWHTFSVFKQWVETKDYVGKHLDKDIKVPNNKVYSKDTCLFVPSYINNYFTNNQKTCGDLPIGVRYLPERGKYRARINKYSKPHELGYFECVHKASKVYEVARKEYLLELTKGIQDRELLVALGRYL